MSTAEVDRSDAAVGSAQVQKPLATVVIGGIVSSTLLTLLGWPLPTAPDDVETDIAPDAVEPSSA
jgi:hypothetical protein